MANASKHHMGPSSQGKGSGTGAMTQLQPGVLGENMVLGNRDKSRHNHERGLDSRTVQTEQYQDHSANRRNFDEEGVAAAENTSDLTGPMTDTSGDDSSRES